MAQLPHISRHPSTNLTKICHIDQSYPKTGQSAPSMSQKAILVRLVPDFGRYEGVAPSTALMSFLMVWRTELEIALIYAHKRQLDGCEKENEGVAPAQWANFGERLGVASSMSRKTDLKRSGNLPLCLALENGPHQVPRKRIFS